MLIYNLNMAAGEIKHQPETSTTKHQIPALAVKKSGQEPLLVSGAEAERGKAVTEELLSN